MNTSQMNELTNIQLANTIMKMESLRGNKHFNRFSSSRVQPYIDEYQRRLLDGRATKSIEDQAA